ncbi:MAG: hypothetical protein IE887_07655 [Campylobacterales bacterium]|nr:hypothetical protein [Campylobacterales bacterium]
MTKLFILSLVFFSACSQFKVTGTMCDNIDPQNQNIPQECRDYNEEKADKAFNKVTDDKKVSNTDIEFDSKGE